MNDNQDGEKRMSFSKRCLLFAAVIIAAFIVQVVLSVGSFFTDTVEGKEDRLKPLLDSLIVGTKEELLLEDLLKK